MKIELYTEDQGKGMWRARVYQGGELLSESSKRGHVAASLAAVAKAIQKLARRKG